MSGAWTRPDAYLVALATKRGFRRAKQEPQRTQPERPRLMLSTVPFLVLIAFLAILSVAIMIIAFPGNQPRPRSAPGCFAARTGRCAARLVPGSAKGNASLVIAAAVPSASLTR